MFLSACSKEKPLPIQKETKAPLELKQYLEAQADGDWETYCQLLAEREVEKVKKSLKRDTCPEALEGAAGERLEAVARAIDVQSIEKQSGTWRADFINPQGTLWVKGGKVYFSEP